MVVAIWAQKKVFMLSKETAGTLRCILLVEDSPIIAMDIEETLSEQGVERIIYASSCEEAFTLLDEEPDVDGALIDFYMRSESCAPVIEKLVGRSIPFGIVTGFGDPLNVVGQWPGVPVLHKPFIREDLIRLLGQLSYGDEGQMPS